MADNIIDILIRAKDLASKEVAKVKESVEGLGREAEETKKNNADFNAGLQAIAQKAAVVSGVVVGLGLAIKKGFDLAEQGAQVERLRNSFSMMAESVGADSASMLSALSAAANGTIAETDLMLTANKAMMLGVTDNAEEMANLLEIAAFRGRALGIDTTQAFEDIATGIGRASPLILDNLGIVFDSKQVYSDYADAIGKTADELTDAEKKQALLSATLETGNEMLADAGGLADDSASSFERLSASFENAANGAKEDLVPVFEDLAGSTADVIDAYIELNEETGNMIPLNTTLIVTAIRQKEAVDSVWQSTERLSYSEYQAAQAVESFDRALMNHKSTIAYTEDEQESLNLKEGEYLSIISSVGKALESYTDKQEDLTQKRDEAQAKLETLIQQGWWAESEAVQDAQAKLDDYNAQLEENTAKFEESTNRRILARTQELLAADGLTMAEEQALLERGLAMGVYTQEYVDEANRVIDESQKIADAINAIPTQHNVSINVSTSGSVPRFAGGQQDFRVAAGAGRASGGHVGGGRQYMVGEQGPELFVPNTGGRIVPNHALSGGGMTFVYSPQVSFGTQQEAQDIIAPFVEQAYRSLQDNQIT